MALVDLGGCLELLECASAQFLEPLEGVPSLRLLEAEVLVELDFRIFLNRLLLRCFDRICVNDILRGGARLRVFSRSLSIGQSSGVRVDGFDYGFRHVWTLPSEAGSRSRAIGAAPEPSVMRRGADPSSAAGALKAPLMGLRLRAAAGREGDQRARGRQDHQGDHRQEMGASCYLRPWE